MRAAAAAAASYMIEEGTHNSGVQQHAEHKRAPSEHAGEIPFGLSTEQLSCWVRTRRICGVRLSSGQANNR